MYQKCHIKIIPIQIIHILKDRTSEYLFKYVLQEKQLLFITILWSEAVLFMPKRAGCKYDCLYNPISGYMLKQKGSRSPVCYRLDCLGRDNGGDCSSLLHHHPLLVARVHRWAVEVAGSRVRVCLYKHNTPSNTIHVFTISCRFDKNS